MPSQGRFRIDFGEELIVDLSEQIDYEFPHPIQRWVMPVVPLHDDTHDTGTAFLITTAIAITARHVVEPPARAPAPNIVTVFVDSLFDDNRDAFGGALHVTQVSFDSGHDIAVLGLRWGYIDGSPFRHGAAPLTDSAPAPGDEVLAFGYYTKVAVSRDSAHLTLSQRVSAVRGVVEEVLPTGRDGDSVLVTWPAFGGTFPAPGGLSGGPIINGMGHVCGIVSRSMAPFGERTSWLSYGALLRPVLDMPFPVVVDGVTAKRTIRELARLGFVPHDGTLA